MTLAHTLHCDEYHEHRAPKCCADNCWCKRSSLLDPRMDGNLERGLDETRVPDHLRDGLIMYLRHGCPPGHFLHAVLSNNLVESISRADNESERGLGNVVRFLYNFAPSAAWGSHDRVIKWLSSWEEFRRVKQEQQNEIQGDV